MLTSRQWTDWLGYMSVIPLPVDRGDFNAALIRAQVAQTVAKKRVKAAKFVPQYGRLAKRRTEAELKALAHSMVTRK